MEVVENADQRRQPSPSNEQMDHGKLTNQQVKTLTAQIAAYKMLARNEPIPRALMNQATVLKREDILPSPYEYPLELGNGEVLPYNLTKILSIHQQRSTTRTTPLPVPPGIDPELILKERENRWDFYSLPLFNEHLLYHETMKYPKY